MTKEEVAVKLTDLFPEKAPALAQHYDDYDGQLLAHVFFADEVNEPLFVLLQSNCDQKTIQTYCAFIEDMYFHGDEDVKNVVEVTILERLSDEEPVLFRQFPDGGSDHIPQEKGAECGEGADMAPGRTLV